MTNLGPAQKGEGYYFGRESKYWTYTRTTDEYLGWKLAVGAAASSGLDVYYNFDAHGYVGVAGLAEVL